MDTKITAAIVDDEQGNRENLLTNAKTGDKQKKIALSVADKIEFVEVGTIVRCASTSRI